MLNIRSLFKSCFQNLGSKNGGPEHLVYHFVVCFLRSRPEDRSQTLKRHTRLIRGLYCCAYLFGYLVLITAVCLCNRRPTPKTGVVVTIGRQKGWPYGDTSTCESVN